MLNGDEYIMMQLEELHNSSGVAPIPDEIAYNPDFEDFYNYSANTDWVEAISRNGYIDDHNFNIKGGGEKARYYASLGYQDNQGTTINQSLQRITTRINIDYNLSRKLLFSVNFSYSRL